MRVFSNSAMSADGKIASRRGEHPTFGSAEDRRMMSVLRAQADAVLVGGNTFRRWPGPLIEDPAHLDWPRARTRPLLDVVLTRGGVLDAARDMLPDPRVQVLVLGPPSLDAEGHRQAFDAEVVTTAEPSVSWALDVIAERGAGATLIEGGGAMLFAALEAGRLEEMFITLCPVLIGGSRAPTVADGRGFERPDFRWMDLVAARQVGSELYLHYVVGGPRAGRGG